MEFCQRRIYIANNLMGEINTQAGHVRRAGVRRSKKSSTRVDLTPMVDMGFLLITFFILTTTWSKPHTTHLNMPADGPPSHIGENASLTLVALGDNKVFYYNGDLQDALKKGSFGVTGYGLNGGIGDIIRQKQEAMDKSYKGGRKEMMLMIKSSADANYKNIVGLLDETMINDVKLYAMVDFAAEEKNMIKTAAGMPVN
jgi:biopolymer transport protein ExbD